MKIQLLKWLKLRRGVKKPWKPWKKRKNECTSCLSSSWVCATIVMNTPYKRDDSFLAPLPSIESRTLWMSSRSWSSLKRSVNFLFAPRPEKWGWRWSPRVQIQKPQTSTTGSAWRCPARFLATKISCRWQSTSLNPTVSVNRPTQPLADETLLWSPEIVLLTGDRLSKRFC